MKNTKKVPVLIEEFPAAVRAGMLYFNFTVIPENGRPVCVNMLGESFRPTLKRLRKQTEYDVKIVPGADRVQNSVMQDAYDRAKYLKYAA